MIHIDGSHMEGGGQILRTALALSTLTGKSFVADNIRHNRPRPGLKAQHLGCIDALKQLASAEVQGARLGAARIRFRPQEIVPGKLDLDIGTAGSITLLLQSLLLPCMFAHKPVRLRIQGGTDVKWSMPIDYFVRVILPFFNQLASVQVGRIQRGFYPRGRGRVNLTISPRYGVRDFKDFAGFNAVIKNSASRLHLVSQPEVGHIAGRSSASVELKDARVAERQIEGASRILDGRYTLKLEKEYCRTASVGTVITLWAVSRQGNVFMGADALGEKGRRAEDVGAAAAKRLKERLQTEAVADVHLADNLVPLLALCGGQVKTDKVSAHIRSNIYVCEKFLEVRFRIDEKEKIISTP